METTKTTRRKRRASGSSVTRKIDLGNMVSEAKQPLLIIGGMFLGTQIAKVLDRSVTPTVNGLLGLDAVDGKKMVTPIILAAGGLLAAQMVTDRNYKMVGYGVAASGGVILAKTLLNANVVPLRGVDDEDEGRKPIPGLGSGMMELEEFPISGNYNQDEENESIASPFGNAEEDNDTIV